MYISPKDYSSQTARGVENRIRVTGSSGSMEDIIQVRNKRKCKALIQQYQANQHRNGASKNESATIIDFD